MHNRHAKLMIVSSLLNNKPKGSYSNAYSGGGPHCIMVKTMDGGIVESEFEIQSRYYVHFQTHILGKVMNPLITQLLVK